MPKIPYIRNVTDFLEHQKPQFKANIIKNQASGFALSLPTQYQALYLASLGASPLLIGYMNSLGGLAMMIVAVPAGFILDRIGIRKVLLATLAISAVGALTFSISTSWEIALIALVVASLGSALDRMSCPMICGSMLKSSERATGMGICDTISMAPSLVAPFAAAAIITAYGGMNAEGIRPIYYLQFAAFLVALAIVYTRFKAPEVLPSTGRPINPLADARQVLAERTTCLWVILTMLSTFPMQVLFYSVLFAAQVKGADQFILGGMSVASTAIILLAIPIGRISDTLGRKKVIVASAFLAALSYFILISAQDVVSLLVAGLLSGFTMTINQTQTAVAPDLVSIEYLGRWYGILGFFRGVISIVAPLVCGFVWYAVSPQAVFMLLILIQALHLVILFMVPSSITR